MQINTEYVEWNRYSDSGRIGGIRSIQEKDFLHDLRPASADMLLVVSTLSPDSPTWQEKEPSYNFSWLHVFETYLNKEYKATLPPTPACVRELGAGQTAVGVAAGLASPAPATPSGVWRLDIYNIIYIIYNNINSLSTSSTKSDPGQNCAVGCTNRHAGDTLGIYDDINHQSGINI